MRRNGSTLTTLAVLASLAFAPRTNTQGDPPSASARADAGTTDAQVGPAPVPNTGADRPILEGFDRLEEERLTRTLTTLREIWLETGDPRAKLLAGTRIVRDDNLTDHGRAGVTSHGVVELPSFEDYRSSFRFLDFVTASHEFKHVQQQRSAMQDSAPNEVAPARRERDELMKRAKDEIEAYNAERTDARRLLDRLVAGGASPASADYLELTYHMASARREAGAWNLTISLLELRAALEANETGSSENCQLVGCLARTASTASLPGSNVADEVRIALRRVDRELGDRELGDRELGTCNRLVTEANNRTWRELTSFELDQVFATIAYNQYRRPQSAYKSP